MNERIDFYSEVIIKNTANNSKIRGKKGIIMAISEEAGIIYGYSVRIDGFQYSIIVNEGDVSPTGKKFRREDFFDGSSIGVTPDGELTRVDIKKD
ncbi:hypothetical protein R84981_000231 [Carnimonas sp. R-84981]|uniref:hypothetical protein n=1 Tax=Carnimonas bestiolae TaxID=3402172 RepID=UPI003EDBD05B